MDLEKFIEKPAHLVAALGLAAGTLWTGILFIPRFFRALRTAYLKLQEFSVILETLREIRESQHESNHIRAVMLDSDPDRAYFRADAHGKMTWCSRVFQSITGLALEECRGSGWENGIAEENREAVLKEWLAAIDHQRNFERTIIFKDRAGRERATRVFASIIRNVGGNREVAAYFGVAEI